MRCIVNIWIPLLIFWGLGTVLGAEDLVLEWERRLLRTDPGFRQEYEAHREEERTMEAGQSAWLPQVSLEPGYSLAKAQGPSGPVFTQNTTLGLTLGQKLPWGGQLSSSLTQNLSFTDQDSTYGYSASGSLSLSSPVLLWNQGFGLKPVMSWAQDFTLGREGVNSSWLSRRREKIAQTLQSFFEALWEIRAQSHRVNLQNWYSASLEADQALWAAGKLSTLDLGERNRAGLQAELAVRQGEKALQRALETLKIWEFQPEKEDLEEWLAKWEKQDFPGYPARYWDFKAQENQIRRSEGALASQEASSLPQINFHFSFTPGNPTASLQDPGEALKEYWKDSLPWGWTLNASLRWPLVPWDPLYQISEKTLSQKKVLEARARDLTFRRQLWEEGTLRAKMLLEKNREQAQRRLGLEKDRLELFALKLQSGQLAPLEKDYQELQVEEAQLEVFRNRIALVIYRLRGE